MKAHATVVLGGKIWLEGSEIPDELVARTGMANPRVLGDQSPVDPNGSDPQPSESPSVLVTDDGGVAFVEPWEQSSSSVPKVIQRINDGLLGVDEALRFEQTQPEPRVTLVRALNEIKLENSTKE